MCSAVFTGEVRLSTAVRNSQFSCTLACDLFKCTAQFITEKGLCCLSPSLAISLICGKITLLKLCPQSRATDSVKSIIIQTFEASCLDKSVILISLVESPVCQHRCTSLRPCPKCCSNPCEPPPSPPFGLCNKKKTIPKVLK